MIALDMISAALPVKADATMEVNSSNIGNAEEFRSALASNTGAEIKADSSIQTKGAEKMTPGNEVSKADAFSLDEQENKASLEVACNTDNTCEAQDEFDLYDLAQNDIDEVMLTDSDYELCQGACDARMAIMSSVLNSDAEPVVLDEREAYAQPGDRNVTLQDKEILSGAKEAAVAGLADTIPDDQVAGFIKAFSDDVNLHEQNAQVMNGDAKPEVVTPYDNQVQAKDAEASTSGSIEVSGDNKAVDMAAKGVAEDLSLTSLGSEEAMAGAEYTKANTGIDTNIEAEVLTAADADGTSLPQGQKSEGYERQNITATGSSNRNTMPGATQARVSDTLTADAKDYTKDTTDASSVKSENDGIQARMAGVNTGAKVAGPKLMERNATHYQDSIMGKARDAGLRVVSSSVSEDTAGDLLSSDAGDTLSLMVKMQNAVRSSQTEVSSPVQVLTSVLRRNADGKNEEKDSAFLDETLKMNLSSSEGETIEGEAVMASENTSSEPIVSVVTNGNHAQSDNSVFAGLMSNTSSRTAVLSGTSASANGVSGFSGAENTAASEANDGDTLGRVQLLGDDSNGNAERINDQVMKMAARNLRQVELELYPRNLGHLKIAISVEDGNRAQVSFMASSKAAKELIGESMPRLKDYMAAAGMELTDQSVESTTDFSQKQQGESAGYERARQAWHHSMHNTSSANDVWLSVFGDEGDGLRGLKIAGM